MGITKIQVLALSLVLALGCGAARGSSEETTVQGTSSSWTAAHLRKLDPELRTRVRSNDSGRYAISVSFLELPTDEELAELLLNRIGERAVGQVGEDALLRIASRSDVERIEPLDDVGYDEL